jgi:hypothetical protein
VALRHQPPYDLEPATDQRVLVHASGPAFRPGAGLILLAEPVRRLPLFAFPGAARFHALQLLEPRFSKAVELLRHAEVDVLAYMAFPADHWRSISSTNAIERLNAEIDRWAKVVGIFPNTASLLRLATALVQDQHDEWQDDRRLFSQHSMARLLHSDGPPLFTNALTEGFAT